MYRFQLDSSEHTRSDMLWIDLTISTVPEDDAAFPVVVADFVMAIVGPDPQDDPHKQLRDVLVAAAELL